MLGSHAREPKPKISLDVYLAQMLQRLIEQKDQLSNAYRRPPQNPPPSACLALTMMSVVSDRATEFPRAAVVRTFAGALMSGYFADRLPSNVSFASPNWKNPVNSEVEYALQLRGVGLIQTRHVPAWTLAEIAHSL
jgi:hypothetical protein